MLSGRRITLAELSDRYGVRTRTPHADFEKHGIETSDSKGAFIGDARAVYSNKSKSAESPVLLLIAFLSPTETAR